MKDGKRGKEEISVIVSGRLDQCLETNGSIY